MGNVCALSPSSINEIANFLLSFMLKWETAESNFRREKRTAGHPQCGPSSYAVDCAVRNAEDTKLTKTLAQNEMRVNKKKKKERWRGGSVWGPMNSSTSSSSSHLRQRCKVRARACGCAFFLIANAPAKLETHTNWRLQFAYDCYEVSVTRRFAHISNSVSSLLFARTSRLFICTIFFFS